MTNMTIIEGTRLSLVSSGIIASEEEIHTYKKWLDLGYKVRHGEKAVTHITIWIHTEGKDPNPNDEDDHGKPEKIFQKTSAFFSSAQVDRLSDGH